MKAILARRFGTLDDVGLVTVVPDTSRAQGEVLIRVRAASLNHRDVYVYKGLVPGLAPPLILGSDAAGVVVDRDADSQFEVGQSVVVYPVLSCGRCHWCLLGEQHKCRSFGLIGGERPGGLSELIAVPDSAVVGMPPDLGYSEAAALAVAGLTAWNMIEVVSHPAPGDHALVVGATGSVGTFALPLLKRRGVLVHAVTSHQEKTEHLMKAGADVVHLNEPASILRAARELPEGGYDWAFNWVGGRTWRYVLPAMVSGGVALTCGSVATPVAEIDMRQVFYRNLSLVGCSMGSKSAFEDLLSAAAAAGIGTVSPEPRIGLGDVVAAYRKMERGELTGKVVVGI